MKYSQYIAAHRDQFWKTCEGRVVESKRLSKALAASLGVPVPKTYHLPPGSFFKPDRAYGGRGCQEIIDPTEWILESRIPHKYDYKVFVLAGRVRMIQVDTAEQGAGKYNITGQSYYRWPDWVKLDADQNLIDHPERAIHVDEPPALIGDIVRHAVKFGPLFSLPIRVDFMISDSGTLYFNELCATPGLIVTGRVTEETDAWLGSFLD